MYCIEPGRIGTEPKGGGLAGNIGGFSNQFMGVKQTTDVLEKGTWIFAAVIAVLCITSTFFIDGGDQVNDKLENVGSGPIPGNSQKTTTAFPAAPAPATDSNKR